MTDRCAPRWVSIWLTCALLPLTIEPASAQQLFGVGVDDAAPFGAPMADQRVFVHALFDELEARFGSPDVALRWDGELWAGTDSHRLWLKSEGFVIDGRVEEGDHELLYDQPVSSYFDLQTGVRYDLDAFSGRAWAALGFEGLAPYFVHLSGTLYASDAGHFAAKLVAKYDELITQRLVLQPLAELNTFSRADAERGVGAGLSELDAGLRLRYEVSRKFAPYLGVIYQRTYGPANGRWTELDHGADWRWAAGVRAWL